MTSRNILEEFHPAIRDWFQRTYGSPTPPQLLGWPSIASGKSTLILSPTGSGKTLAAFLWAINHLVEQHLGEALSPGFRILYISPLKALNNDIERNLQEPLRGIREEAHHLGVRLPAIHAAVRTGDTPPSQRAAMLRHPPDILITTPESFYLMLTSRQARRHFRTVQYVIIDEIHSLCANKRGVHLSLSLERLQALAEQDLVRIGLSATQRPLERIAAYLGGCTADGDQLKPRPVTIVDAGEKKAMDLRIICAVPDFSLVTAGGVWPLIFEGLLALIRTHRTTLIFVNNRRLAERLAATLNEMAESETNDGRATGPSFQLYAVPHGATSPQPSSSLLIAPLVSAYHGSMSRKAREGMERALKAGALRALVATSALELGIDIGSIDCVVQVESPKGVARGLQRVGRSGHLVTAESKGRIFPTHREDLVESTVVGKAMRHHEVEPTVIPRDCLDVLAQQIVAMVSVEQWDPDALYRLVRQSYCYRDLPRAHFSGVLEMLSGRYASETFRELRPRISWDRVNHLLRALPGSSRLAILGGGTISDRGYYGVFLEDGKTKVGEVDEEFVFETRVGDTFILGTSIWKVREIDPNRLLVAPAPGQPARMPFWHGEGIGRSFELGAKVGEFRRLMSRKLDSPDCLTWLQSDYPVDLHSAWNLQQYFRRQLSVTGVIPHDRLLLIEGFRDEIGDPRIVVHSVFGRRVNGLLGLVLAHRLQERIGIEPQMLYDDNGIILRSPDADGLPLELFEGFTAQEAQETILEEVLHSPLFSGQFRQNAARALLLPKGLPGRRVPLWLQRLRAADLLDLARRSSDFPIVIETVREVLQDVLDLDHFREIARGIENATIEVRTIESETPSPFAANILFGFIAAFMYEGDQPRADAQSQYLTVNRELLAELVKLDAIPALLRPEAIEEVERELQHAADSTRARSPEELMELLLQVGDLSEAEILTRCESDGAGMLASLASDGRAVEMTVGGEVRWVAGEEQGLYADLSSEEHARKVVRRYLQSHGPVGARELANRFGFTLQRATALADSLTSSLLLLRGPFRQPVGSAAESGEWCYGPSMERIHRRTLAILRKEITPCTLVDFSNFLLHWQHLLPESQEDGPDGLLECLQQLQGLPLPSEVWERDILRRRLKHLVRGGVGDMLGPGEVSWIGSGPGRMFCALRGEAAIFLPAADQGETSLGEPARRIYAFLEKHGASFLTDLRANENLSLAALNSGLAELFWHGQITNDVFHEVSMLKRSRKLAPGHPLERIALLRPERNPQRSRLMGRARRALQQAPGWTGRWSIVHTPSVMGPELSEEERVLSQARQLLERYGIVARELCRREALLPWPPIAMALQRMEMRGEIRRGYFVEGFSGMQYADPLAIEELRKLRASPTKEQPVVLLNACDPANPYGLGVNLPLEGLAPGENRLTRVPGNFIAFQGGSPILWIESEGARIWSLARPETEVILRALDQLLDLIRLPEGLQPLHEIRVEYWDGERPATTSWAGVLRELGFRGDANQTLRADRESMRPLHPSRSG